MSHRFEGGYVVDVSTPAFAVVSGAISGTTPKVSGWIKLAGVDTVAFVLTTTSTANGVWTADVARDGLGKDAKPLPTTPSPAFPTGTSQNTTSTITMPGDEFVYLRLTFTPSAGSGNANAQSGLIVSAPVHTYMVRQLGVFFTTPAADTLAGTQALKYSGNFDGRPAGGGQTRTPMFTNDATNPAVWTAAVDSSNAAISLAALVASTGMQIFLRLGIFEPKAIRYEFTPTAGFGHVRVYWNGKA